MQCKSTTFSTLFLEKSVHLFLGEKFTQRFTSYKTEEIRQLIIITPENSIANLTPTLSLVSLVFIVLKSWHTTLHSEGGMKCVYVLSKIRIFTFMR